MTQEIAGNGLDAKYVAVVISSIIAVLGWLFSSYINTRAFKRNETSKAKDKISSMFESFFDKLEDKMHTRKLTEMELDDIISSQLTMIELHLKHFERKIGLTLVESAHISRIRSEPLEYISDYGIDYKRRINELKFSTLELIEENYTNWYFRNSTKHCIQSTLKKTPINSESQTSNK